MSWRLLILPLALVSLAGPCIAADKQDVRSRWHTPFDLYLDPREAFEMKASDPDGVIFVDVRTRPEVQFVGFSELADANIPIYTFDTQRWSTRKGGIEGHFRKRRNPDFLAAMHNLLASRSLDKTAPVILMCTSGSRSPVAARALHEAGFSRVYTQHQGFEGIKAESGPRQGKREVNGWKNAGLPWGYRLPSNKMYFNFAPQKSSPNQ